MKHMKKRGLSEKHHMWNGRELSGIGEINDDMRTRTAWANLVLAIFRQAVNDYEGIKRVGIENIIQLNNMYPVDANVEYIEEFINFKSDISYFYQDLIHAYFALRDGETTVEKLT